MTAGARLTTWSPTIVAGPLHSEVVPHAAQVDAERAAGIRAALELIRQGRPGLARYTMTRSVMRQNRIAGGGTIDIHPTCPCGGRCPNGGS